MKSPKHKKHKDKQKKHKSHKRHTHQKEHRVHQQKRSRSSSESQRNTYRRRHNKVKGWKEQQKGQFSKSKTLQRDGYEKQEHSLESEKSEKKQSQNATAKEQPCFEPSGILLEFYNSREGVPLRFSEPPESRRPTANKWRIYVFKGEQVLSPIHLNNSCYLIGKDDRVCDVLAENPSISRQHSVIQFRLQQRRSDTVDSNGNVSIIEEVKPYILDLDSTNGTFLNDQKIESSRYYELLHKDVLKFGFSEREYVIVEMEGEGQIEED